MAGKQPKCADAVMEPSGMASRSAQHRSKATMSAYPPEVFDQVTDLLADLVLADLRRFPQIPTNSPIDRFDEHENTVFLTQEGGE